MLQRFLFAWAKAFGVVIILFVGLGVMFKFTNPELTVGQLVSGFLTNPVVWGMVAVFTLGGGLIGMNGKPDRSD